MKRRNYLKGARVVLAILFFTPILLFFVDFRALMPAETHQLMHLQIVPLVMTGLAQYIVLQAVLLALFGRIYCSVICPAGVLQDIINRIYSIGKKKKHGAWRFRYRRPANGVRYGLLALVAVLAIFGFTELLQALDPYSNFGRIAANLFRPAAVWTNNIAAGLLARADNYALFHVTLTTVTLAGLLAAGVALALFVGTTVARGRLFCNTLCPVGALLSLGARYSLLRVTFNPAKCNNCRQCERTCKAEAINTQQHTVDNSRCVACFNCISTCRKGGIRYSIPRLAHAPRQQTADVEKTKETTPPRANTRRQFLATSATVAITLPPLTAIAQTTTGRKNRKTLPITPPGSRNIERFKDKCTACHLCVTHCPSQVLYPAGLQFGLSYALKPHMAYTDSYCNYECTVCADICPNKAITLQSVDEKKTTQVGIAHFFLARCIVETENTDCGACSEHCPTQAVHMEPYKEGSTLTVPVVEPHLCIGCGGCESICPVRPQRAIIIKANPRHQQVQKPAEEEVQTFEIDEFGF